MVDEENLLVIDGNLESFQYLHLQQHVKTINVHCNNISKIEGLENLIHLEHLDISSNKLTSTSGLHGLVSLSYLNLASNFITTVSGLASLKQLLYLNLSYNKIHSLDGVIELHGAGCQLETIELHGNELSDMNHIKTCLQGVISLKHLVLKHESHGNPVCNTPAYREKMLDTLPQLISLDHVDRSGNKVEFTTKDEVDLLAGLDWDFALPEEVSHEHAIDDIATIPSDKRVRTPHIDAALAARNKSSSGLDTYSVSSYQSPPRSSKPSGNKKSHHNLEKPMFQAERRQVGRMDSETSDFSSNDTTTMHQNAPNISTTSSPSNKKSVPVKLPTRVLKSKRKPVVRKKITTASTNSTPSTGKSIKDKGGSGDGVEKQTYLNLLKELETERERRWKAEQASRKLVGAMRDMQSENCEGKSLQQMAANTAERLKQTLLNERDANELLKQENLAQVEEIKALNERVASISKEKQSSIRTLQNALSKTNVELSRARSSRAKEKQDADAKISMTTADHDAMKMKHEKLQIKLTELQDMMVSRDAEYRKSLSGMFSMDNVDFRNALSQHMNKEEKIHQREVYQLEQRIRSTQQDFSQLENEFREALYIESERYKSVLDKYNAAIEEATKFKSLSSSALEKEEKCRSLMQEMTSIIKEQKVKISELLRCKEETKRQYKDRIDSLEQDKEDGRKKGVQLELVKQEKSRLISQLTAVQSVVDGLKEERKVWGRELAQQGSSLAQDRGRLEMKIESLNAEVSSLRKNNERDLDALRIKTKVVEDQTETIFKMKAALTEKDKEVRLKLEEQLLEQRRLQETIEDLTQENASLQEDNLKLNERKQQLKAEMCDMHKDHESLQDEHERLKKKWLEKGALLSKLELQVKSITVAGKQRETKLAEERDDALRSLQLSKNKSDQMAAAYQEQMSASNVAHEREMERLQRDKHEEVQRMENKIISVEKEMSDILRETELQKKNTEEKFQKLKSMFQELT